jgi:hypothetical protein
MSSNLFDIVFAELLRLEIRTAARELDERYPDGGRASGDRSERLAAAAADAYRAAVHAVGGLPINAT